jgi:ABC-2 type transport system ATP-binding protein
MNRKSSDLMVLNHVSAGYGDQSIVTDIDLKMSPGDILGLLGANGSGKTTLLKAITGQIVLMAGGITINGIDLGQFPESAKSSLGLAIEPHELPLSLTGQEYLEMVASIRGCDVRDWPCAGLTERLDLDRWLDLSIWQYSLGTRARIAIAAALLGAPPLLIFDESLNGLDPVVSWEVKAMLRELAATGKHAVVISTHVLESVPSLCNRAALLASGRIVAHWNAGQLVGASQAPGFFEAAVMQTLRNRTAQGIGY